MSMLLFLPCLLLSSVSSFSRPFPPFSVDTSPESGVRYHLRERFFSFRRPLFVDRTVPDLEFVLCFSLPSPKP